MNDMQPIGGQAHLHQNFPNPMAHTDNCVGQPVFPEMIRPKICTTMHHQGPPTEEGKPVGMGGMSRHKIVSGFSQEEGIPRIMIGV
jgi:hypothetical protein